MIFFDLKYLSRFFEWASKNQNQIKKFIGKIFWFGKSVSDISGVQPVTSVAFRKEMPHIWFSVVVAFLRTLCVRLFQFWLCLRLFIVDIVSFFHAARVFACACWKNGALLYIIAASITKIGTAQKVCLSLITFYFLLYINNFVCLGRDSKRAKLS